MVDVLVVGTGIHYSITHVEQVMLMEIAQQHPGAVLLLTVEDTKQHLGAAVPIVELLRCDLKCIDEELYKISALLETQFLPAVALPLVLHIVNACNRVYELLRASRHPP